MFALAPLMEMLSGKVWQKLVDLKSFPEEEMKQLQGQVVQGEGQGDQQPRTRQTEGQGQGKQKPHEIEHWGGSWGGAGRGSLPDPGGQTRRFRYGAQALSEFQSALTLDKAWYGKAKKTLNKESEQGK